MSNRVVITGIGVVSPNGVGNKIFIDALKAGKSGVKYSSDMEKHNLQCQIGGLPEINWEQ